MKRQLGLWAGIGACLPPAVWLAGMLHGGAEAEAAFAAAASAAGRLQALALLLFAPVLLAGGPSREGAAACASIVLIPLPLFVLAWLAGVSAEPLARALGLVLACAIAASALTAAAARWLPGWEPALGVVLAALALRHGAAVW